LIQFYPSQEALTFPVSLADKYSPRHVRDFLGLEDAKAAMLGLLRQPRSAGFLFVGPPGSGKTTMGMALAEDLPSSLHHVPAQKCDVAMIDQLWDQCQYYPARGKWHVILIDEIEQATEKAQLALLSKRDNTANLRPVFGGGWEPGRPLGIIWVFTCNGLGVEQTTPPRTFEPRFLSRLITVPFPAMTVQNGAAHLRRVWKAEGQKVRGCDFKGLARSCDGIREALMQLEMGLLSGRFPTPRPVTPVAESENMVIEQAGSHVRYCRPEDYRAEDFPGYVRRPGLSAKGSVVLLQVRQGNADYTQENDHAN
jgi:hypothetical protein